MIKILLLDFDGILTNGKKSYSKDGICNSKELCDKDFTAIKRFIANGVPVFFLTGDPWNENVLKNRNLPFLITRGLKKDECAIEVLSKYNIDIKQCAYIGDDIFDLELLSIVGHPFCPNDAIQDCKNTSVVLNCNGGENLINYFFEYCVSRKLIQISKNEIKKILDLDEKEKF
jgi:3-deoxy-D-manno-octulosonate 8-phosphate phosphatase (KDO 8-P phosphatase)